MGLGAFLQDRESKEAASCHFACPERPLAPSGSRGGVLHSKYPRPPLRKHPESHQNDGNRGSRA